MRNVFFLTIILLLIGVGLNACGGSSNTSNSIANAGNKMANAAQSGVNTLANAANSVANAVSSATTPSPESFMKDAAQGGKAEIELGKLASQKSKDPEIKKFGQMMVTDHGAAGKDLEALAKKKNFTLPADIGSHQSMYDDLNKLSGADFDKKYVDEMVKDHESDLAAFKKQAENATDADVKAFAAKVVPVVQKHLDAIKAIQAKMNK